MVPVYSSSRPEGSVKNGVAWVANLILLVCGLLAGGCSRVGGGKVTGSVLLDGKPLPDAQLGFFHKDKGAVLNGAMTDAEGNFQVRPDKVKHTLQPGTYIVLVQKYMQKDGKAPPPEQRGMLYFSGALRNTLPDRYSSVKASPLIVEIKPGDNALPPLELKSN
jgi:hypothetical protein